MKTGLQVPHFRPSTPATMRVFFRDIAQATDQAGFDSLWVMDHFLQLGEWLGAPETDMVEGYATLGYFAAVTERIRIGLLVGGVIYRHPAIVVKSISTLDVLSGGRVYFGIGAAWYDHECASLGLPFPPLRERFERLEETLQIAHHMWSGNTSPYNGNHYQMAYPVNNPQPLSKPHPPIMIGGMGKTKTLRFVAQYGDACNFFGSAPEHILKERLEILQAHCEAVGRSYDEIEKTVLYDEIDLSLDAPEQIIERSRGFQTMGFDHVIYNLKSDYTVEAIQTFADHVIPALKD